MSNKNKSVEEVKILTFRDIKEYWGLHIGPKSSQDMQEKVLYKIYEKLRQTSQEREREIVEKLIQVVAGVDNYANPLTANDCIDEMKAIAQKYNITLTNPNKD